MTSGAVSPPAVEPVIDAATDIDHRCEYHVRDLGTRSVTLFPTRAHVVRDIRNVPLKVSFLQFVVLLMPGCLVSMLRLSLCVTLADHLVGWDKSNRCHRSDPDVG